MALDFLSPEEKANILQRIDAGKLTINSPEIKALIQKRFESDPLLFARHFLKDHFKDETPAFHHDLISLAQNHKRLAIAAPRGHAKSTVLGLAYVLHQIVYRRSKNIIFISASEDMAKRFLRRIKEELETNALLIGVYGNLVSAKWSETEFETANQVAVHAKGRGAMIRGLLYRSSRPDLIILDDIEDEEMVRSELRRQDLAEWFNGAVLPSLEPATGQVILVGTVLHTNSLLANLLDQKLYPDFFSKRYQAVLPDNTSLWPGRFPPEAIQKIKESYVARHALHQFFMEYQNDPTSKDSATFRTEYFQFYDTPPDRSQLKVEIYVDLGGGSISSAADPTAIVVLGLDQRNDLYVLDYVNAIMGSDAHRITQEVFQLVAKFKPSRVVIEKTQATNMFLPTLYAEQKNRRVHFVVDTVVPTKGSGQSRGNMTDGKYQRIAAMEGAFKLGVVKIKRWMIDLQEQLLTFPRCRHDDLIDALAYGYMYMNRNLAPARPSYDLYGNPIQQTQDSYQPLYPELGI